MPHRHGNCARRLGDREPLAVRDAGGRCRPVRKPTRPRSRQRRAAQLMLVCSTAARPLDGGQISLAWSGRGSQQKGVQGPRRPAGPLELMILMGVLLWQLGAQWDPVDVDRLARLGRQPQPDPDVSCRRVAELKVEAAAGTLRVLEADQTCGASAAAPHRQRGGGSRQIGCWSEKRLLRLD